MKPVGVARRVNLNGSDSSRLSVRLGLFVLVILIPETRLREG